MGMLHEQLAFPSLGMVSLVAMLLGDTRELSVWISSSNTIKSLVPCARRAHSGADCDNERLLEGRGIVEGARRCTSIAGRLFLQFKYTSRSDLREFRQAA